MKNKAATHGCVSHNAQGKHCIGSLRVRTETCLKSSRAQRSLSAEKPAPRSGGGGKENIEIHTNPGILVREVTIPENPLPADTIP